ncbi:hypothetical protein AAFF_G00004560 [Aldrovandia affinis]|uniref:Uncharacterized protein n=1 Tax=Aldrovandia affinis TaxID=143900 RepID=A0AAD7TE73_9TELE|nr:hypothetical protein AAFF_G00004560 [Aldrovandia affinis]
MGVTTSSGGTLQPWLVGLAATVGFLFIVFVMLIIKRFFKKDSREGHGYYDNKAMQVEYGEEESVTKQTNL